MNEAAGKPGRVNIKSQIKELLTSMSNFVDYASEDDQRRLLKALQALDRHERRRHPRKTCSIPITVGSWRVLTEFARNISAGGVFIETSAAFSRGEHLTLMFSPPNQNTPLKLTGRVARSTPEGIGVQFTSPPTEEVEEVLGSL